jgi:hypothetical protein
VLPSTLGGTGPGVVAQQVGELLRAHAVARRDLGEPAAERLHRSGAAQVGERRHRQGRHDRRDDWRDDGSLRVAGERSTQREGAGAKGEATRRRGRGTGSQGKSPDDRAGIGRRAAHVLP